MTARISDCGKQGRHPHGDPGRRAAESCARCRKKQGPLILTNSLRRPWTSHGFQTSWRIAATKAGIVGVTFTICAALRSHALPSSNAPDADRGLTGHSLRDVRSILDANYLHRDPALGESAIRKLEAASKLQNFSQLTPN